MNDVVKKIRRMDRNNFLFISHLPLLVIILPYKVLLVSSIPVQIYKIYLKTKQLSVLIFFPNRTNDPYSLFSLNSNNVLIVIFSYLSSTFLINSIELIRMKHLFSFYYNDKCNLISILSNPLP